MKRQRSWIGIAAGVLAAAEVVAGARQAPTVDLFGVIPVARMTQAEFRTLHAEGAVLVIDVRSAGAYRAGHIPGAISVPLAEVEERVADIRAGARARQIVTYCSCPTEHTSVEAAKILLKHGVGNVSALIGGYEEWVRRGEPN